MSRHVSLEILALYREGAVTAAKAARIDAHLAGCARCSGIDSALASLPGVLAATEPPPMPEAFAVRIQMAITRESAVRAGKGHAWAAPASADSARASSSAGPVGTGTGGADSSAAGHGAGLGAAGAADVKAETGSAHVPGQPDLPQRRRSRSRRFRRPDWSSPLLLRGLAAAAAVVVIAGAGILLANARTASQNSGGGSSASGARHSVARPRVAGPTNRHVAYGAQASSPMTLTYRLKGKIATTAAVVGHANVTVKSLPGMVRKRVASVTSVGPGLAAPTNPPITSRKVLPGGVKVSALQGCLSAMADGRQVLLADIARFMGRPAVIIVLKPTAIAHILDVAIVGVGCSASSPDMIRMLTVPVP